MWGQEEIARYGLTAISGGNESTPVGTFPREARRYGLTPGFFFLHRCAGSLVGERQHHDVPLTDRTAHSGHGARGPCGFTPSRYAGYIPKVMAIGLDAQVTGP